MDSLKTLMDKKQYDLVLKLTENSQDSLALFYRLSALLATGRSEDALKLIKDKRQILIAKPGVLMKIHIELLCLLGKFDEAYSELNSHGVKDDAYKYYEYIQFKRCIFQCIDMTYDNNTGRVSNITFNFVKLR